MESVGPEETDPTAQSRSAATADIIPLDAGSDAGDVLRRYWQAADQVVLVTTPDPVATMDTYATVKGLLSDVTRAELEAVVNRVNRPRRAGGRGLRADQYVLPTFPGKTGRAVRLHHGRRTGRCRRPSRHTGCPERAAIVRGTRPGPRGGQPLSDQARFTRGVVQSGERRLAGDGKRNPECGETMVATSPTSRRPRVTRRNKTTRFRQQDASNSLITTKGPGTERNSKKRSTAHPNASDSQTWRHFAMEGKLNRLE